MGVNLRFQGSLSRHGSWEIGRQIAQRTKYKAKQIADGGYTGGFGEENEKHCLRINYILLTDSDIFLVARCLLCVWLELGWGWRLDAPCPSFRNSFVAPRHFFHSHQLSCLSTYPFNNSNRLYLGLIFIIYLFGSDPLRKLSKKRQSESTYVTYGICDIALLRVEPTSWHNGISTYRY